jgi:hypothetical protein
MSPKRRRSSSFYNFWITSSGQRPDRSEDQSLQKKPYEIDSVRFEVYSRGVAIINLQGKILDKELKMQTVEELKSCGAKSCSSGAVGSRVYLREENRHDQNWLYDCDFRLAMFRVEMVRTNGKKTSQDEMVWDTYQRIARDLRFPVAYRHLEITHSFFHLVNRHWISESDMFRMRKVLSVE